jgi:hypothetical protein
MGTDNSSVHPGEQIDAVLPQSLSLSPPTASEVEVCETTDHRTCFPRSVLSTELQNEWKMSRANAQIILFFEVAAGHFLLHIEYSSADGLEKNFIALYN